MGEKQNGLREWAVGGVLGGVAGFAIAYLSKGPYCKWRAKHGLEQRIHHKDIGVGIATFGMMVHDTPVSPLIVGFGTGIAAEDYAHHITGYDVPATAKNNVEIYEPSETEGATVSQVRVEEPEPEPELEAADEHLFLLDDDFNLVDSIVNKAISDPEDVEVEPEATVAPVPKIEYKNIPDWPPVIRTKAMGDIIRQLVYEDMHHPEVRRVAESILAENHLDGREYEDILTAMQTYIQTKVRYVHDELRSPQGKASDRYSHAYLTLPKSPTNPAGTGAGDCDDMVIAFLALAGSVGVPGIMAVMVDQTGNGYSHIMAGWNADYKNKPSGIGDVTTIELTEPRPFGWRPRAKKYGFLLI